jgi:putative ABC transport system ATP-binding protein
MTIAGIKPPGSCIREARLRGEPAGKTTLLSMVGRLLRPTRESVLIAGRTLAGTPSDLARLRLGTTGFVFQTFNPLPGFSAIDNVALPL